MPRPPIRIRARGLSRSRAQVIAASATSEPLRRLFISSIVSAMMANSSPRRIRRRSVPPPGTDPVSR
jgi:hypothetical protein